MNEMAKDQVLKEFKTLFEGGKFEQCLEWLRSNQASFDPSVYNYNLGITYLKLEHPIAARFHLEKAEKSGLKSLALEENLKLVKNELGVQGIEHKESFADYFYPAVIGLSWYSVISVSSIIFIFLYLVSKNLSKNFLRFSLLLIALTPAVVYKYFQEKYVQQLVMKSKVVYRGPSNIFEQIQELPEGTKVISEKQDVNGWTYILIPESHRGWIKSGDLEKL